MRQIQKLLRLLSALIEYDKFYRENHESFPDYAQTPCTRKNLMVNVKGALKCARLTAYDAIDLLEFEGFIRLSSATPTVNRSSLYLLNMPLIKAEYTKIMENSQRIQPHTYTNPTDLKELYHSLSTIESQKSVTDKRSKVSQKAITATGQ